MNLVFCNTKTQNYSKTKNKKPTIKMQKKSMNGLYRKVNMNLQNLANSKTSCGSCGGR